MFLKFVGSIWIILISIERRISVIIYFAVLKIKYPILILNAYQKLWIVFGCPKSLINNIKHVFDVRFNISLKLI